MKVINKKSISLVELMLTVVILSMGIVMILKSFLSIASALGYTKNKIAALQFLDGKIAGLQEMALKEEDILEGENQGEIRLGEKDFSWVRDFFSVVYSEEEIDEIKGVNLDVFWKEGNINKQQSLSAYINLKGE
ncbi:MAG: hypothetical protein ISS45_04040 [Candidatus Omnitrophica bacterium]|nr:hypothetical protein [Candidatus Omnitrophota bacterium]